MDNNELKIKFANLSGKIDIAKSQGEDTTPLLKEKIELLQIGYKKLQEALKEDRYEKNPKKYSTLLSYLNNIKAIQNEINIPTSETDKEILNIYSQMEKAGLGWLLKNIQH